MKKYLWVGIFVLSMTLHSFGWAVGPATLYELYEGKSVKVFIEEIKDSSPQHKLNPPDVKRKLAEALGNRKSIRFQVVEVSAEADVSIGVDLKDFYWTDHDPIDMLMGIGGAAADAAIREDYVKVEADFLVKELKKNSVLWKDRVIATITKKPMSEAERIPLVAEDLAKVFIRECFGKKRK